MAIKYAYSTVQYIGQIQQFPYNYEPIGWVECNGQLLSIQNHKYLYDAIGTIYGSGGTTSFAVPDLRPRDNNGALINLSVGQTHSGYPYMKHFIAIEGVLPIAATQSQA